MTSPAEMRAFKEKLEKEEEDTLTKIGVERYARKPFYVEAACAKNEAMLELLAKWCGGELVREEGERPYVQVEVQRPQTPRQTQAFVGDWLLSSPTGFKVYTDKAFRKSFEKVDKPGAAVIHRSAESGEFVSKETAEANPDTTVKETAEPSAEELTKELNNGEGI